MPIFRAIVISALSIPFLVFVIFFGVGLVFLLATFIQDGSYNKGWLGMVYAGAGYSFVSLVVASIPTIVLGWPASLIANMAGFLGKKAVLSGSTLLGSVYLGVAGALFFGSSSIELVPWLFIAGAIGGLINGTVFLKYLKPNKSLKDAP